MPQSPVTKAPGVKNPTRSGARSLHADHRHEYGESLGCWIGGVFAQENSVPFSVLLDRLPTAVYAIDKSGSVIYFNRAAAELAGREPQIGSDKWCVSWKLYRADGSFMPHDQCLMAVAMRELREIRGAQAIVERPDGSRVWVEPYPTILYDADRNVVGAVNVLVDITEQKRAADALLDADRRKNEFLAQLAHELRNPLAPIHNGLHVLHHQLAGCASDDRVARLLGIMRRQADHLIRLVDDLLDVSRITNGKIRLRRAQVDLVEVLHDALGMVRVQIDRAGHRLDLDLPSSPIAIVGDAVRLTQVFANLLSNAAKYTEQGGSIRLWAEQRGEEAVVRVEDSGVGIPPEMQPRIFDFFTQADTTLGRAEGGLGIGLALVKRLIELHGGTVEVQSPGVQRGSTFTVRLPVAAPVPRLELRPQ